MLESNYKARQSLNVKYSQLKGARAIDDIAVGFGKGWIVFAVLSTLASAFSFYQDFYKSLGVVITILLVIALAIALEVFKHLSIKGLFSSMNFLSKSLVSIVAVGLISVSFYTHFKSINTFQANLVQDDLKTEIAYQRDIQKVQNGQIEIILDSNKEFAKALNNGSSHDDKGSIASVESNSKLIATLQKISAQNNMTNTNLILRQSRATAHTTSSAILVIFIMIEIMALFSILSKIIIVDNVSDNVKDLVTVMDRLDELEDNTYQSLTRQQITATEEKIKTLQQTHKEEHVENIKQIGTVSSTRTEATALPSPTLTTGEKGQVWSNPTSNYPTLPTNISKIYGTNGSNVFFQGTAENFTDAYEGDGFKVEKYPLVPRKHKKTRIVKELGEFKILDDICRDSEEETEFESEKVGSNYGFDADFISAEEWAELSDHAKGLALSYIDLSLFDAVEEVPMIQIAFENGLINTYDEPLLKKTEVVTAYKKMRGGTLQDARDIYVKVMEKLEKQDKIVRRSRYHNRCQGINIGKVTIG